MVASDTDKLTDEQISAIKSATRNKTKEERFLELIQGIEINKPVVDFEKYPNSLFWFDGDKLMFEYDWEIDIVWVSYNLIWEIFESEFKMEYSDIKIFIKIQVEQHFKLKGVTPLWDKIPRYQVEMRYFNYNKQQ